MDEFAKHTDMEEDKGLDYNNKFGPPKLDTVTQGQDPEPMDTVENSSGQGGNVRFYDPSGAEMSKSQLQKSQLQQDAPVCRKPSQPDEQISGADIPQTTDTSGFQGASSTAGTSSSISDLGDFDKKDMGQENTKQSGGNVPIYCSETEIRIPKKHAQQTAGSAEARCSPSMQTMDRTQQVNQEDEPMQGTQPQAMGDQHGGYPEGYEVIERAEPPKQSDDAGRIQSLMLELQEYKKKLENAEMIKKQADNEIEGLKVQLDNADTDIRRCAEDLGNKQIEIHSLKQQLECVPAKKSLQEKVKELERQIKEQKQVIKTKTTTIETLQKQCQERYKGMQELFQKDIQLQKDHEEEKLRIKADHEATLNQYQHHWQKGVYERDRLKQSIEDYQKQIDKLNSSLRQSEEECRSLSLRLSKFAGAQLVYNNPNIADLSDAYRPTKLGEMFSELYDNEWTDSFEELHSNKKLMTEVETTQYMMQLLKRVYDSCKEITTSHMTSITKSITSVTVTMDVRQANPEPQAKTSPNKRHEDNSKHGTDREEPMVTTPVLSKETEVDPKNGDDNPEKALEATELLHEQTEIDYNDPSMKQTIEAEQPDNDRPGSGSSVDPEDIADKPATRSLDDQSNTPNDGRSKDSGAEGGTGKGEDSTNMSKEVQPESDNGVAATADVIDRVEEEQCSISIDEDRLSVEQKKQIADLRKFAAVQLQEEVIQKLTEKIMTEKTLDDTYPCTVIYIQKCAQLCWLMCLHKPPVVIGFVEPTDDTRFEKDKYKEYTKTGKWLDFVVWPPLYLHEGGPMLSKGTAQGRKDKK